MQWTPSSGATAVFRRPRDVSGMLLSKQFSGVGPSGFSPGNRILEWMEDNSMRRAHWFLSIIIVGLSLIAAGALAQDRPSPDATPGAVGITGVPLGSIEPTVAPGHRLDVVELTWEPGAYASRHFHPTALITCVQSGALGFVLDDGNAWLTRGGTADTPGSPEPLELGTEVILEPRDCITFDEMASHMEHTGWNASEGTTVLWEARLLDPEQPFTTYVDAMGTPIP